MSLAGLRAFGRALRPAHAWKNVVVGAALLFGHRAADLHAWANVLGTFLAFCAVSSAGYLVNDVVDRAADRARPTRAARPVATGEVSVRSALFGAAAIYAASFLAAAGYLAWTQAPDTVALHGTRALAWTAVPVVLALARFRSRLRRDTTGQGPAELVARDPVVLGLGALWVALCAWVLYA